MLVMDRARYRKEPPALRHAILERLAQRLGLRRRFAFSQYDALDRLCRFGETGKRRTLFEGVVAECRYGEVAIFGRDASGETWAEVPLSIPGKTRIEAIGLTIYAEMCGGPPTLRDECSAALDADALRGPCIVRMRRAGDAIRLEGGGRQKIKALLIDRKIPRTLRNRVPIFASGGEIFWAGGVRRAAVALLAKETKRVLLLRMVWDDGAGFGGVGIV